MPLAGRHGGSLPDPRNGPDALRGLGIEARPGGFHRASPLQHRSGGGRPGGLSLGQKSSSRAAEALSEKSSESP